MNNDLTLATATMDDVITAMFEAAERSENPEGVLKVFETGTDILFQWHGRGIDKAAPSVSKIGNAMLSMIVNELINPSEGYGRSIESLAKFMEDYSGNNPEFYEIASQAIIKGAHILQLRVKHAEAKGIIDSREITNSLRVIAQLIRWTKENDGRLYQRMEDALGTSADPQKKRNLEEGLYLT